jgi:hypothetical protein
MTRIAKALSASMILILINLSLCTQVLSNQQSNPEILTNDTIIMMTAGGLGASVIVNKIKTSKTNFNLSTSELLRLKQARVADEVINAMMQASPSTSPNMPASGSGNSAYVNPNDPAAPHEPGVYVMQESNGKQQMVQLEASVYSQAKAGGFLKSSMTMGISKVKTRAVLAGANARLQLDNPRPVFYFYFEVKNSGLSNSGNVWYSQSSSPNEFVLVKTEDKKNSRELIIGQANVFGAQAGTLDKYVHQFDYDKIAPGVFRVTPRNNLPDGEYCFFYAGSQAVGGYGYYGGSPKVFDFGVKLER